MRVRLVIIAASVLLLAPAALAVERVRDERKETAALAANGRVDIVRAAAGGSERVRRHAVVMRKRVRPRRRAELPVVAINVRGGHGSDPEFVVRGSGVFRVSGDGPERIGRASLRARGKRWVYRFRTITIGGLPSYGWAVLTSAGDAVDVAPAGHYARSRP